MIHIKPELIEALRAGGRDAVIAALGQAIELEHATIPPYLYALYSLDPAKNGTIAQIIESVVVEEMLHMTLACNILNALGGSPDIDRPTFIPRYPGPLPGSVEGGLQVGLAPFSTNIIHDVFMVIEEPENPDTYPLGLATAAPQTIGEFYGVIKEQIAALGDSAFSSTPRNQVGPLYMDESVDVTNVDKAIQAINIIVDQGEGTTTSPLEVDGPDYAHYYRFAELYFGKKLVKNPNANKYTPRDEQYEYAGDPVPFDPNGVYPIPVNPRAESYPAGSAARRVCDTFNYTYTSLLKTLHQVFNGQPEQINTAIGLMMSLKQQAQDMMSGTTTGKLNVGPSFEYHPVNR